MWEQLTFLASPAKIAVVVMGAVALTLATKRNVTINCGLLLAFGEGMIRYTQVMWTWWSNAAPSALLQPAVPPPVASAEMMSVVLTNLILVACGLLIAHLVLEILRAVDEDARKEQMHDHMGIVRTRRVFDEMRREHEAARQMELEALLAYEKAARGGGGLQGARNVLRAPMGLQFA